MRKKARVKKQMAMLSGIGLGAAAMYVLDPDRGRRRRALARDKVVHIIRKSDWAIEKTGRDLGNRARGVVAEVRSIFGDGQAADEILKERVRARVGRLVSHPAAIDVRAWAGRVRLSGSVLADEVDDLLRGVRMVRGVEGVDNHLEVHSEPGNVPGLQGPPSPRESQFEYMQAHWAPGPRLIAGVLGGAMATWGFMRRNPWRLAIGFVGAGLLGRAITNIECAGLFGLGSTRAREDHDSAPPKLASNQ